MMFVFGVKCEGYILILQGDGEIFFFTVRVMSN